MPMLERFGLGLLLLAPLTVFAGTTLSLERLAQASPATGSVFEVAGLARDGRRETLQLEAFEVFTDDARLVNMTVDGERPLPLPRQRYFRGQVVGDDQSSVVLIVHADGRIEGALNDAGGRRMLARNGETLVAAAVADDGSHSPFQCALHDHQRMTAPESVASPAAAANVAQPEGSLYNVRLAVETDTEFLARFAGNTTNATNYVGALVAYLSGIYVNQLDTQMQVSFLRLWTTPDPFVETDAGCALLEVGKFWNDTMGAQVRTTMHFFSGKSGFSGIAWVGVLCGGAFNTSPANVGSNCPNLPNNQNYGGAYGITKGMLGNFNPGNPIILWDSYAVAHELGHNFNSPHTHCYGNIGGNPNPVDQCEDFEAGQPGCFSGTPVLPGGAGSGTIMSYCHLLAGGFNNVSMTFGRNHAFGVAPVRVPDRMLAHVVQRAGQFPSCLALPANPNIFANGFE
jgi:hypothetical protein